MNIHEATQSYENWMRSYTSVVEAHLPLKHTQMRDSPFLFFRGTFYRWAQLWPDVCASLRDAPKVLAVGDLHVGSFGTWRDTEGRLSWGVDDFDESYPLPYTNDLVRLAASVKIVIDSEKLTIGFKEGCSAILEGYQKALKAGGCPFVLAEHEKNLDRLGVQAFQPPDGFWEKHRLRSSLFSAVSVSAVCAIAWRSDARIWAPCSKSSARSSAQRSVDPRTQLLLRVGRFHYLFPHIGMVDVVV